MTKFELILENRQQARQLAELEKKVEELTDKNKELKQLIGEWEVIHNEASIFGEDNNP